MADTASAQPRLRVLSFNIQYGQPWDDAHPDDAPCDLVGTIEAIRSIDADVVLLQEVEAVVPGGAQPQPPPNYERLRKAFPAYHGCFAYPPADECELPFGYGLAILCRWPLSDIGHLDLPAPDIEFDFYGSPARPCQRVALGATADDGVRRFRIWNTHLQAFFMIGDSADAHPLQRDTLIDAIRPADLPMILGGDFNTAPDEGTVAAIEAAGFTDLQKTSQTWRRRPYVLDHLFVSKGLRAIDSEVITTAASDHHLLVGHYEFA